MAGQVVIQLITDISQSTKNLEAFAKDASNKVNAVAEKFSLLGKIASFDIVAEGIKLLGEGIEKVLEPLRESIDLAEKNELALTKMNIALKLSGSFSQEASAHFNELGESIQRQTGVSNNAVLNSVSLAKSYGLTNEQAEKLTKTAVNLAALQGGDLNSATQTLIKSYEGQTRALKLVDSDVSGFSEKQLRAGAAVDLLSQRLEGFAVALTKNFAGAVKLAGSSLEDIFVSTGKIITQNPVIISLINSARGVFDQFRKAIDQNSDSIIKFVNIGIVALANGIPIAISGIQIALAVIKGLAIVLEFAALGAVELLRALYTTSAIEPIVVGLVKAYSFLGSVIIDTGILILSSIKTLANLGPVSSVLKEMGVNVEALNENFDELSKKGKEASDKTLDFAAGFDAKKLRSGIDVVSDGIAGSVSKTQQAFAGVDAALETAKGKTVQFAEGVQAASEKQRAAGQAAVNSLENQYRAVVKLNEAESKKFVDNASKDPFKALFGGDQEIDTFFEKANARVAQLKEQLKQAIEINDQTAVGKIQGAIAASNSAITDAQGKIAVGTAASVLTGVSKGALGATEFISKGLGAVADKFVPGIGGAVAQIFTVLAAGPAKVKEQVDAFTGAIPGIINSVVAAIPVLVTELVKGLFEAESRIADNLPTLVEKFIEQVALALQDDKFVQALLFGGLKLSLALQIQAPFIAASLTIALVRNAPSIGRAIAQAAVDEIKELFKTVTSPFQAGGQISKVAGGVGKIFGFAEGGKIPPGYDNDNFPVGATSGELIIERSTTGKLEQFLDAQKNSAAVDVARSLQSPNQSAGGGTIHIENVIQVGETELARTFLNLKRNGHRLEA